MAHSIYIYIYIYIYTYIYIYIGIYICISYIQIFIYIYIFIKILIYLFQVYKSQCFWCSLERSKISKNKPLRLPGDLWHALMHGVGCCLGFLGRRQRNKCNKSEAKVMWDLPRYIAPPPDLLFLILVFVWGEMAQNILIFFGPFSQWIAFAVSAVASSWFVAVGSASF